MAREDVAGVKGLWRGDTLTIKVMPDTDSEFYWDGQGDGVFTVQVARARRSEKHGWLIVAMEPFGPGRETHIYLNDGWDIRDSDGRRVVS